MDRVAGQDRVGERLHSMVRELYPICRSITGDGLRQTLQRVGRVIPLELHEVPSGTAVLDWEVPPEWNIRGARIETLDGRIIVDFARSNLHVVNYSKPVDRIVSREELAGHVHTLPDQPTLTPYRTAYHADTWGFCVPHAVWQGMHEDSYRVLIDSTLGPGSLTYGELRIPGERNEEVLISVHCCHPSLANDNLSGIVVATELARRRMAAPGRLGYRFLFIPATIGSIAWLSLHEDSLVRIRHGLVLSCVGDPGPFHYKRSRRGDADIDRAVSHVLRRRGVPHEILPFTPYGYDERQYCSPAYNLPVGCFMRSPNGTFPEYHTSADNPDFVTAEAMAESVEVLGEILDLLDANRLLERIDGRGEPQLGRRGLYRSISGQRDAGGVSQMALLWVLNLADGCHSLLDIAERAELSFQEIQAAASILSAAELIREV